MPMAVLRSASSKTIPAPLPPSSHQLALHALRPHTSPMRWPTVVGAGERHHADGDGDGDQGLTDVDGAAGDDVDHAVGKLGVGEDLAEDG